jgi:hypothetical protein
MTDFRDFEQYKAKKEASRARKEKRAGKRLQMGSKSLQDAPGATIGLKRHPDRATPIPKAKLRKRLISALDREFSLLVRELWPKCFFRDPDTFIECGKPTKDCFHFFTRAKRSIRWDLRSAVGSCKGHNIKYEQDQAFIDDVRIWYVARYGPQQWDDLKLLGNKPVFWDNDELNRRLNDIIAQRAGVKVVYI